MTANSDAVRGAPYTLLFVCTGNTCRSPMAMAIARAGIERRGWKHVTARSAGVATTPDQPPSPLTEAVLREHGIELGHHTTTPLDEDLVRASDLILVMSPSHLFVVNDLGGGDKVSMVTDFLENDDLGSSIEDPFGSDIDAYRRTYVQLERAIETLLSRLEPILAP